MRMPRWFRQRRPVPPPPRKEPLSSLDAATLLAWGLGLIAWRDFTDQQRAWYRDNITKAPYFTSHTNV